MILHLLQLGRIPYTEGLRIMREVAEARRAGVITDTLLLMEHPPVLTLGRNAHRSHIVATGHFLAQRGVEIHEINRGGDITYHGPGQLVGYPIFDLRGDAAGLPGKRGPFLGPVDFVRLIEEALIHTCKDFNVPAQRIPKRTGVWTVGGGSILERKIAAIGIHVAQGITTHGFALNVTTDLRDFNWIVPCGITDREVTSLEQEADPATEPTLNRAADSAARNFGRVFHRQVLASESLQALLNLAGTAAR
jgi:lipoyl(octanoyl) transferase